MRFAGRKHELQELDRLYGKGGFQMVVLYGRRRVGKTTLAQHFAEEKPAISFTAKVQSDALNLADFSRALYRHFGMPEAGRFTSWEDAFSFLAAQAKDEHLVFLFDEFPYAAGKNASLVSTLQIAIDRDFRETNIFLILTGSNQGFMEEKVLGSKGLGSKNPLFGRRTAQIHLAPFSYADAALMLPDTPPERLVEYYACFGGTPYYLGMIDERDSLEENVTRLFFCKEGLLYEEPMMLLRQELREPALYSSILNALAHGANKPQEMADRIGESRTSMSKYLGTLQSMGLVEHLVPFGENAATSRKGIYRIKEPCFAFWYRFVQDGIETIERDAGELAAREALQADEIANYVAPWFEDICLGWVIEQAKGQRLPFAPSRFGKWWGTNSKTRQQDDVDLVAASPKSREILVGECKWRNSFDEAAALRTLSERAALFEGYPHAWQALFTKKPASDATRKKHAGEDVLLVSAEDLYSR